jgi:hypothetical protein
MTTADELRQLADLVADLARPQRRDLQKARTDLRPCDERCPRWSHGVMFVSEERVLAAEFGEAAARLAKLPRGDWTRALSAVYEGGVEYLLRVGPVGALTTVPGVSRLVRVRFAEPLRRPGMMTVGLRWEAAGMTGGLFPALDADIQLTEAPGGGSRIALTGSYRPPLGSLGVELDRFVLATVASSTIRALLTRVASDLEGHADGGAALTPWPPEPIIAARATGPGAAA